MLSVRIAQRSCTGAREHNEDRLGVECTRGHWCLVLSDGAGGHRDGAIASRLVVDRVLEGSRCRPPIDGADLAELLLDAHDGLIAAQRERGSASRTDAMHATVVVLLLDTNSGLALWGHVGDSRLYLLRGGRAFALTRDDSLIQVILDSGLFRPEELEGQGLHSQLTAALGAHEGVEPHVCDGRFEFRDGDAFLLCSDGWWGSVTEAMMVDLLATATTAEEWLDAMVASATLKANPAQDNFSAIGCWIGDPTEATQIIQTRAMMHGGGDGA